METVNKIVDMVSTHPWAMALFGAVSSTATALLWSVAKGLAGRFQNWSRTTPNHVDDVIADETVKALDIASKSGAAPVIMLKPSGKQ